MDKKYKVRVVMSEISLFDSYFPGCQGPASAGSRGYPQDERHWREKERRYVRPALIGPSLRMMRERERKKERERVTR